MRKLNFALSMFAALTPLICFAEPAPQNAVDLHADVAKLYTLAPHTLDKKGIQDSSASLDQFWAKAKSQRAIYLTQLRRELADFSNPPFFFYDGSQLLLSLSDKPEDRKIALAAISHCDLRDVQPFSYFMFVHSLAAQGENTTAAAFHILDDPNFQVIIAEHALTLGQDLSLIYLLFPTSQDFWLEPAIQRVLTEKNETAQKSLLLLIWYAQTAESDKAIETYASDLSKPSASVSYAKELIRSEDDKSIPRGAVVSTLGSESSLRQARQQRMNAVSDEALDDFNVYTQKIIAKRKAAAKP
jgi:hypothetical protein